MKHVKHAKSVMGNNLYILKMIMEVKPFRVILEILIALIGKITEFALYILLVRYLLNSLTLKESLSNLVPVIVSVLTLRLFVYIIRDLYEKYYVPVSDIQIKEYMNEKLYRKASEIEISCYEDTEFYDQYVKAIEQAGTCTMETLHIISQFIGTLAYIVLACGVIFSVSKVVFLVLLFPICIGGIVSRKCNIVNKKIYDENIPNVRKKDYVNRVYNLRNYAEEVRTTHISRLMQFRYKEAVDDIVSVLRHYGFQLCTLQYIFFLSNEVIADLCVFLYASYSALITKTVMLGDFYVLIDSLGDVSWALREVVDILFKLDKNAIYIECMKTFIEYEPKLDEKQEGLKVSSEDFLFEFKSVSFRYHEDLDYAIKDVNFTIQSGEKVLIVGENGSGKTTLTKLLLRLYDVTEGRILLNGHDIKEYSVRDYRQLFGTMFQDFKLFAMSIKENILLEENEKADGEVVANLKYTGLYNKIDKFENGIDSIITKEYTDKGVEFSLGEQQKLVLSRMLTQKREIFILDEPSSSLDPIAEHEIFETVCKKCENRPVIFISHRLSSALLADKIIYLEKGMIKEMGTFNQLMDSKGRFYKMFKSQSENYVN